MTGSTRLRIFFLTFLLLTQGCSRSPESKSDAEKSKFKEVVKEVVTQEFKSYEGAKQSLKEVDQKSRTQLETIDKELKTETQ